MEIVASPSFGLSPLGLIHLRQTINIRQPLRLPAMTSEDSSIKVKTKVTKYRTTDRGVEVDISSVVTKDESVVWEGVTTLLSRNEATRGRNRSKGRNPVSLSRGNFISVIAEVE